MLKILSKNFNHLRKKKYFQNPLFEAKKKYACIGIGMHSITNIYPVLRYFNIPVKYICTLHSSMGKEAKTLFPECVFTNDIAVILNDAEIDGVFVCASANAHYDLASALLNAGKKIFIEKPPCSSSDELNNLIAINQNSICKVGLQRRYWPAGKTVLRQSKKASSYIYQFYFGPYPQGNVFNELFIHAIDYSIFLFGDFSVISSAIQKNKPGISVQLHVKHSRGITGLIDLSTQYSWNDPVEQMSIHCEEELLTVKYPLHVSGKPKPKRLLNLPLERIYQQPIITKDYFSAGNLVMPVIESNSLFLQGFYQELDTFIKIVEQGIASTETNDLPGLRPVYKILDELNVMD